MTSCNGRDPMTRKEADATARRVRQSRGVSVDSYRCKVCGQWHVGTPNRAKILSTKGRGK